MPPRHTLIHTYRLIISILYQAIHILHKHNNMSYSAKSTDDFNDFMSYLGGAPLPSPRKEEASAAAPSRPAPARQSSTVAVAKPAPVASRGSSSGSNKSNSSCSSTLDDISVAHLHFNPKLRNSIRA